MIGSDFVRYHFRVEFLQFAPDSRSDFAGTVENVIDFLLQTARHWTFKRLEFQRHQVLEFGSVVLASISYEIVDRRTKSIEAFVKAIVQASLLDELPETLDQVQVR